MASNKYKITNHLDKNFIAKIGKFKFECTQCGKCCRNIQPEDKVLLTSVDIWRMAKALDMDVPDFIGQYCDLVPGGESMLPLLVLKDRMDGSCIMLKKGLCTVHEGKPLVCALNPLGRYFLYNEVTGEYDFHYFLRDESCEGRKQEKEQTVQEWLDRYGLEEYDESIKLYKRLGAVCSRMMHDAKTIEEKRELFQTAFFLMYAKLNKDVDIYGQLAQNLAFIQSIDPQRGFDKDQLS